MLESPDLAAAKQLLNAAKRHGFAFQRIAPGEDGPLWGVRQSVNWVDEIYLGGFSGACTAARRRRSSLVVPGGLPVTQRVSGGAIAVLHTVVCDWAL